jgi:LmbE family N-acetylglucosaminyl deacetylase
MGPDRNGDLGTILGVWAHPDDEAYLSAALMALAVDAGRRVVCVTATAGEAGFPDDDPRSVEVRKAVRRAEMAASLRELRVTEHRWLGYGDGHCSEVPDDEAVDVIAAMVDDVQPDTVLTFGPDGATGHPDHIAASRWATKACGRATSRPRLLYATKTIEWIDNMFGIVDPSQIMMVEDMVPEAISTEEMAVWLRCDGDLLDRKMRALRAQSSQIEPLISQYGLEWFHELVRDEFFRERRATDPAW